MMTTVKVRKDFRDAILTYKLPIELKIPIANARRYGHYWTFKLNKRQVLIFMALLPSIRKHLRDIELHSCIATLRRLTKEFTAFLSTGTNSNTLNKEYAG